MSTAIPAASSFPKPTLRGCLTELVGRRWLFQAIWKKRYCVLNGSKLYVYDSEDGKGTEANVVCLEDFDVCEEQDYRKIPNVFVITTVTKGYFEASHVFSADTLPEMCDWIAAIRARLSTVERQPSLKKRPSSKKGSSASSKSHAKPAAQDGNGIETKPSSLEALDLPRKERLNSVTKSRARGPSGRRLPQRKSQVAKSLMVQTASTLPAVAEVLQRKEPKRDSETEKQPAPTQGHTLLYEYSSSEAEDGEAPKPKPRLLPKPAATDSHDSTTVRAQQRNSAGNQDALASGDKSTVDPQLQQLHDRVQLVESDLNVARGDISSLQENVVALRLEASASGDRFDQLVLRVERCERSLADAVLKMESLLQEAMSLVQEQRRETEDRSPEPTTAVSEIEAINS